MLSKAKILLVDDHPTNLKMLSSALSQDYSLHIATSGYQALKLAESLQPDLILLDVMMPGIDGLETLQRLRSEAWGKHLAVVLLTADDRAETQISGLKLGADDFISKPFVLPILQARVRNLIEKQLVKRALTRLNHDLVNLVGSEYYQAACHYINDLLRTDIAFVGRYEPKTHSVEVITGWADGQPLLPFRYALKGSPCEQVLEHGVKVYPDDIQKMFPEDKLLVEMNLNAYVGSPLFSKDGRLLGIIVASGHQPLAKDITRLAGALLEIFVEPIASEIMRNEALFRLEHQLDFEKVALQTANALASASFEESFDLAVSHALEALGRLLVAERCYLFQFTDDGLYMSNTHEWCSSGVESQRQRIQQLEMSALPWFQQQLFEHNQIMIARVVDLPEQAVLEKTEFELQGIQSLACVGMHGREGKLIGFIGLDSVSKEKVWDTNQLMMLKTLASVLGSVIERKRAEATLFRQTEYRRLLQKLATAFINVSLTEIETEIKNALSEIGKFFAVDRVYVFDYDFVAKQASNSFEWCEVGVEPQIQHLQNLHMDLFEDWVEVHTRGESLIIDDLSSIANPVVRQTLMAQNIQSLIAVPLLLADQCLGFVGIDIVAPSQRKVGALEQELLVLFADLMVNVKQREKTESYLNQAASVFEHANEGIMITDHQGLIEDVNSAFVEITGYSRAEAIGKNPRFLKSDKHSKAFYEELWSCLVNTGHWRGEIWNRRKNGEVFPEILTLSRIKDDQGRVLRYVGLFSDISMQKAHQSQLEYIAHYDSLTGLPNRVLLADRLKQAMAHAARREMMVGAVYLDLDGFKDINDRFGHDVGDQLLIQLSDRMKHVLREIDTLARIGGDEFVALLVDIPDQDLCIPLLNRLLKAASEPVEYQGQYLRVSASIGVSFFPQFDSIDADQLLRQADQAMYQAKLSGKNRFHLFDAEEDKSQRDYHEMVDRIARAITLNEFELYYQPKVNMRLSKVIGVEALIRWNDPTEGFRSPVDFLPFLMNHPLMVVLGDWVMSQAMMQIEAWRAQGIELPISVNVDAVQLAQDDFVDKVKQKLAQHPSLKPGDLELEIIETSALHDIAGMTHIIKQLTEVGVTFSLDDFGIGYSSLSYLKRLPVQTLKIDQSFVRDMLVDADDLAILKGVIGLSEAFQRVVIAEGVETAEHGEFLMALGCDIAQGYAIARPMPEGELLAWLKRWNNREGAL
ncbi:EAL domain-containing protein [Thiomicrospira microaerophila]|uniref:EAL domain-containing protein n=1 Tax=Thiomicrospira microaerophila TaxID=406020 RepID=UPI00200BAF68|nr:EAL domain-containing protein [Thiomicrospira microaerophila]UQB41637.1 EAL domain-containing protein [Thiomicrospira microaerophila]